MADIGGQRAVGGLGARGAARFTLIAAALAATAAIAAADRVETIDLRQFTGSVICINSREVAIAQAASRPASAAPTSAAAPAPASADSQPALTVRVPLADVASITLGEQADPAAKPGPALVVGPGQLTVVASNVALADGKLLLSCALTGTAQVRLSVAQASMIYLPGRLSPREIDRIAADLKARQAAADVLIVQSAPGRYSTAEGVIKAMDDKLITFNYNNEDRQIPRQSVLAVALAGAAAAGTPAIVALAADGCSLPAKEFALADDVVVLGGTPLGDLRLPREALAGVRLGSARVTDLGDLKPRTVGEHGVLDKTFPYRLGRSVGGGPLRLGGRTYWQGLGLHSYCELTYGLDGAYSRFVTLAGIDDAVAPAGDADLTLLADGKPLGEPMELKGGAEPRLISIDVTGVKTLTIRVGFGADALDAADHVDLASPRLIK